MGNKDCRLWQIPAVFFAARVDCNFVALMAHPHVLVNKLGGRFKDLLCSTIFWEMIQFD